jgi:hypothetical protein
MPETQYFLRDATGMHTLRDGRWIARARKRNGAAMR